MNEVERFIAKVDIRSRDECWPWLASLRSDGYGQIQIGSHKIKAHRYIWELCNGPIPEGKLILHKCNNRYCVNPGHLYLGDYSDNHKDLLRSDYTQSQPLLRKFYDEEIWLIRKLLSYKITQGIIAKMFKVSHMTISRINATTNYPSKGSINKGDAIWKQQKRLTLGLNLQS